MLNKDILFKLDDHTLEFHNWAKHHPQISTLAQCKRANGDINKSVYPEINELIKKYPERVSSKMVNLYNSSTHETEPATYSYLIRDNATYIEKPLDYYTSGASNTSQTTTIKLVFQIEEHTFITSIRRRHSGYGGSLFSQLSDDSVEEWLDELCEDDNSLLEHGIQENDFGYEIISLDEHKYPVRFEIEKRELLDSLISVSVIEFNQVID